MTNDEERLCRAILSLSAEAEIVSPAASCILLMLASAVEMGDADDLAVAVLQHSITKLYGLSREIAKTIDCVANLTQSEN